MKPILCLAGVLTVSLAMANPIPTVLQVPFAPADGLKLDGRLDEAPWGKAAHSGSFVLTGQAGGAPVGSTQVRAFFDVRHLYIGFMCNEPAMDRLIPGIPAGQTDDAPITSNGDVVEIFADTDDNPATYFHLRITPSGATADAAAVKEGVDAGPFELDGTWQGDWAAATSLGPTGWTAEVRIALTAFGLPGTYAGTPGGGSAWRMQFARVASPRGEFSVWSPNPPFLFHSPSHFGRLVFGDRPEGGITLSEASFLPGAIGENRFTATIGNSTDRERLMAVDCRVEEFPPAGSRLALTLPPTNRKVPPRSRVPFEYTIPVREGGRIHLNTTLREGNDIVHAGRWRGDIFPLPGRLERIRAAVAAVEAGLLTLSAADPRRAEEVERTIGSLRERTDRLADEGTGAFAERAAVCGGVEADTALLEREFWNGLRAEAAMRAMGATNPVVAVGVEHPHRKVFADAPFRGAITNRVTIRMAQNEYESAQLVLWTLADADQDCVFELPALTMDGDADSVIRAHFIEIAEVGFIDVGTRNYGGRHGLWPDVLYPGHTVTLRAGRLQPVMITVRTRPYFKAGTYRGTLTVRAGAETLPIDIAVEVWPFALPDRMSVRTDLWFWKFRPALTYATAWNKEFGLDLFTHWAEVQGRYHIGTSPRGDILADKFRLVREADGTLRFDFSRMIPFWEAAWANGANVLHIEPLGTNYFVRPEKPWQPHARVVDAATGEESDFTADDPGAMAERYLKELCDLFRQRGWLRYAVYLAGDEPWGAGGQEAFRRNYERVKRVAPDLVVTGAGTIPRFMNLDDHIDVWCPQFRQYDRESFKDHGKGLWFYQCLYKPGYPMFMIDRPGIEPRMAFWLCWKEGVDGFLYWTTTAWDTDPMRARKLGGSRGMNRWIGENWELPMPTMPGDGCFFYPQPHRVVASLRAQAIRDGIEDYEYLAILRRRVDAAGDRAPADLVAEARALLEIPEDVVSSVTQWTTSPERLDDIRARTADVIVRLSGAKP